MHVLIGKWWRRSWLLLLFAMISAVWCAFTAFFFMSSGEIPPVFVPHTFAQTQTKVHQDPPHAIRLFVFLPLFGLKNLANLGDATPTEERLSTQSWGVVASHLLRTAPPGSSVRILGMVGAADHCDPWISEHIDIEPPSSSYLCFVLPPKCLHHDYDDIPKLNCIFEVAIGMAHPDELLVFANGDILVTPSFAPAFLNMHHYLTNVHEPDGPSISNFVLVGQRTDVGLEVGGIPVVLTLNGLQQIHTRSLNHSVLHQDFGIDYFVFPKNLYPHDFPSFLVGRFRWDNSLLASFIMNGAKVIDMTGTITMLHLGINPADAENHIKRVGAIYNDNLAHDRYGQTYMLGRIRNADYEHVLLGNFSFHLAHRNPTAEAKQLRILQHAGQGRNVPFLLLVTVTTMSDLLWAKKWMAWHTYISRHVIFLTHDSQVFEALEMMKPGYAIMQATNPYATPTLAVRWLTFWKLLNKKLTVAITNVDDFSFFTGGHSLLLSQWPSDCDIMLRNRSPNVDIVAVRSRPNTTYGLQFFEIVRDCNSAHGRDMLKQYHKELFGPPRTNRTMTRSECLSHLMTLTVDVSDIARPQRGAHRESSNERFRICYIGPLKTSARESAEALRTVSLPYDFVKQSIAHAKPIDNVLHIVMTVSNSVEYTRRYKLARQFIEQIESYDRHHVTLYIVELTYGNQTHRIARPDEPRHLQLHTATAFWHKENLINLAVERLLPKDWRALAWIDAEIEFESPTWALDTLHILGSGAYDIVQLFSHGLDLDARGRASTIYTGFGYNYQRRIPYQKKGKDLWHPGYAWACTRKAYDQIGGLFEGNILGGNDQSTAYAILGMHAQLPDTLKMFPSPGYKKAILEWESKFQGLRLGYVPGVVNHHFHGSVKNRRYWERRDLLSDAAFDPQAHLRRHPESGILTPTESFPAELSAHILEYFRSRKEDGEDNESEKGDNGRNLTKWSSFSLVRETLSVTRSNPPCDGRLHLLVLVYSPPPRGDAAMITAYHILVADYLDRLTSINDNALDIYIVEITDSSRYSFHHTRGDNPRHLQIHRPTHQSGNKGNILNLAIKNLLPRDWRTFAYIDAGAEFDSLTWPRDTLHLLSENAFDVVQMFSHAIHLDAGGNTTQIWTGFGYNSALGNPSKTFPASNDYHPGLAWAYSRRGLEKAGGVFFEYDIEGQDFDFVQAWSLSNQDNKTSATSIASLVHRFMNISEVHRQNILDYVMRWQQARLRVGNVPGVVRQINAYLTTPVGIEHKEHDLPL